MNATRILVACWVAAAALFAPAALAGGHHHHQPHCKPAGCFGLDR